MNTKQVIVVRTDLRNSNGQKIRTGKIASQVAHASLGALLKCFRKYTTSDDTTVYNIEFGKDCVMENWLNGIFTKICVSVDSEEELLKIYDSLPNEIPKALITDSGLTEFNGVPTITCIGIGPYISEEIDKYTGHLKLL
jgi:PTH2 family peptidyl-tRNA hydrolase